jgi:hypothetical protein
MIRFSNMIQAGLLPDFFSADDPRPAWDQLLDNYPFGSGKPFEGFKLRGDSTKNWSLNYPGDPSLRPVSFAMLRHEALVLFEYAWLAIIQPTGEYIVYRVD